MSHGAELEAELGCLATAVVASAGGSVTFEQYDNLMRDKAYISPIEWIDGWGDRRIWKSNNDKLCAFSAVKHGLLKQTKSGYEIVV